MSHVWRTVLLVSPIPKSSPYDTYLLDSRVRYVGDWVAFVAAETPTIAEEALALIEVDYEVLPAVFDPLEAMRDGAPQLHEPDVTHPSFGKQFGDIYDAAHNHAAHEVI